MNELKRYGALLLAVVLFTSCHTQRTIFMAGDSTSEFATQEKKGYIRGWAQMLPQFLNDEVKMDIRSRGGRSTKSFIAEGISIQRNGYGYCLK